METKPKTYTKEFVKDQVEKILGLVLADKDVVYIGEVFEELPYPRQTFSEWRKDFEDCSEISDTIDKIKEILETRVNVGGLKRKLDSSMTKFNLINNYKWKDKSETDVTTKGESLNKNKDIDEMSDKVIKDYLNERNSNTKK